MIAEGQSRAIELYYARAAALQNFDRLADVHAELLQTVNFIRPANQLIDPSSLTGCQHLKRKRVGHGGKSKRRVRLSIAVETESHYAIALASGLQ